MNGRVLLIDTGSQNVGALQDLLEVKLSSSQAGFILRAKVMQTSDASSSEAELLAIDLKKATGSYTSGSGGSNATVVNATNTMSHGLATATRNNTTQASDGTGSIVGLERGVFNVLAGEWEFTPTVELSYPIGPSEGIILSLPSNPADALTLRAMLAILLTHG